MVFILIKYSFNNSCNLDQKLSTYQFYDVFSNENFGYLSQISLYFCRLLNNLDQMQNVMSFIENQIHIRFELHFRSTRQSHRLESHVLLTQLHFPISQQIMMKINNKNVFSLLNLNYISFVYRVTNLTFYCQCKVS